MNNISYISDEIRIEEKNKEFLNDFVEYLKETGLSETTIRRHKRRAKHFIMEYCGDLHEEQLDKCDLGIVIVDMFNDFSFHGFSENDLKQYGATVKKILKYMLNRGMINQDEYERHRDTVSIEVECGSTPIFFK